MMASSTSTLRVWGRMPAKSALAASLAGFPAKERTRDVSDGVLLTG